MPLQDKAIKRFSVRNMVEAGAMNDLKLACFYDGEAKWLGAQLSAATPPQMQLAVQAATTPRSPALLCLCA